MMKPSRSLEKGREAPEGFSLWVESADSSEKRIRPSAVTEPSEATQRAASVSPLRIASMPCCRAVAPEAQAVESEIGRPWVRYFSASL